MLSNTSTLWFVSLIGSLGIARGFVVVEGNGSALREWAHTKRSTITEMGVHSIGAPTELDTTVDDREERGACYSSNDGHGDNNDGSEGDDDGAYTPPHPSKMFAAPNLDIKFQPIESNDIRGHRITQLLPLQKYHARAQTRRSRKRSRRTKDHVGRDGSHQESLATSCIDASTRSKNFNRNVSLLEKSIAVRHDIPSLDFIYENLSRFPITKSSQVLLEEYHDYKQIYIGCNHADRGPHREEESRKVLEMLEGRLRSKIRAECRASLPLARNEALQILYCDSHICVVNKPSGVLSVPGHRRNPSLADLVYDTIQPSSSFDGSIDNIDQSVVHRLDMATSGIIVYALSKEALQNLHVTFRDRKGVQKTYQALVEGHLVSGGMEGEIDVALERDPTNPPYMRIAQTRDPPKAQCSASGGTNIGKNDDASVATSGNGPQETPAKQHKFFREAPKPSKTTWSILGYEYDREGNPRTRLALRPHTGRTHQLRVHTSRVLGAPIVGDDIYGSGIRDPNAILCLHAQKLCLKHPITGAAMVFEADPPF